MTKPTKTPPGPPPTRGPSQPARSPRLPATRPTPRSGPPSREPTVYAFAVLRAVPHPFLGAFVNVGVVLHARTAEFLGARVIDDPAELARRVADVDPRLLARYLAACRAVAAGDEAAGPVALAPPSERFHWLTAPRSDVLQSSPVHEGLCDDPAAALEELFAELVGGG